MNIEGTSVYVGPNVHAKEPLIRLTIDVKPSYAERLAELGGSVIEQLLAVLPGLAVGVAFEAFAGCDRTFATCQSKFGNSLNFGGFPWIPAKNPFAGDSIV